MLPEDILASTAGATERTRVQAEGKVNAEVGKTAGEVVSKASTAQSEKSKEGVVTLSKTLKDNLIDSIHQSSGKATSFLNSLKKDKIRNLERVLGIDKKGYVLSSKEEYTYTQVPEK